MSKLVFASALIVGGSIAFCGAPSFSANARHPYQNVNHRNDRGQGNRVKHKLSCQGCSNVPDGEPSVARAVGNRPIGTFGMCMQS